MHSVIDRVRSTIRQHNLADAQTRVIAAVSGGSDSTALAHLLSDLSSRGDLRLVGIVHFNHQLRDAADDDERVVARMAAGLDRPFLADREDVRARARREQRSLEDAARTARYEFFERARAHFDAGAVALGHTRDDQAETFLLRLVRGAGPRGLASIYPRNGAVIRPLLECRREDLRAWLAERGIGYVEDETNRDVSIPRNRVRAELLPMLTARFNPSVVDVLAGEAELSREAWSVVEAVADETAATTVKRTDEGWTIDIEALNRAPLAVRRIVLWRVMNDSSGSRPVGFEHVADALRLLEPGGPRALDAPGHQLERIGSSLVLRGRANLFWYPLSIPGEVLVGESGCTVSAQRVGAPDGPSGPSATASNGSDAHGNEADRNEAIVRGDLCRGSLAVRNRRRGDQIKPCGPGGRKKLQDYFVEIKVGRYARDLVPLVVDEHDRIVWVAGFGIDEAFRVTDPGQAMVVLRLSQTGWGLT